MPSGLPDQDSLSAEANRLYWESDQSVNQIGEGLDLSKGVLYGLIAPLPTGLPCPQCGEEMVFPNRTAREKGFLACPDCGMEEEEEAVRVFWRDDGTSGDHLGAEDSVAFPRRAGKAVQKAVHTGRDRVSNLSPRGRIITGTALLGVAAGLVLAGYLRKR